MIKTDGYYNKVDGNLRQTAQITVSHYGDFWYSEHFYQMDARGFWENRMEPLQIRVKDWSRAVEMLSATISRGGYHHSSEIKSSGVI
jgi:hypothetical protein